MKEYFLIGEDIDGKQSISEEDALWYLDHPEDDYKVLVLEDSEEAKPKKETPQVEYHEPDWVPFSSFKEKEGYVIVGHKYYVYDAERDHAIEIEDLPARARKTDQVDHWEDKYCLYVAAPKYKALPTPAIGECAKCKRYSCSERMKGERCPYFVAYEIIE